LPAELRSWLLDTASLTDRLKRLCEGDFHVQVMSEGWVRPRLDERRVLRMRTSAVGWVREVQLFCGDRPRVYARTVIPARTLTGAQRRLAHLGNRPLGAWLFANPRMQRDIVELARIDSGQAMFSSAVRNLASEPRSIWGRRSVFRVGGKPLLVTEVFLPGLTDAREDLRRA
jgi:chorismate--pyruvate lyase